ncbi:hypothetical protein TNCV_869081 [Trichonephila clavipes]|nr:hypothetical protein TNCV_869081 [Trichonephila clavipes]
MQRVSSGFEDGQQITSRNQDPHVDDSLPISSRQMLLRSFSMPQRKCMSIEPNPEVYTGKLKKITDFSSKKFLFALKSSFSDTNTYSMIQKGIE